MATIILASWREGLQKVSLTKLQQELLRLPLKEAKENVDRLLDGSMVTLNVADEVAGEFFKRASELGAIGRFPVTGTKNQSKNDAVNMSQQAA